MARAFRVIESIPGPLLQHVFRTSHAYVAVVARIRREDGWHLVAVDQHGEVWEHLHGGGDQPVPTATCLLVSGINRADDAAYGDWMRIGAADFGQGAISWCGPRARWRYVAPDQSGRDAAAAGHNPGHSKDEGPES